MATPELGLEIAIDHPIRRLFDTVGLQSRKWYSKHNLMLKELAAKSNESPQAATAA